MSGIFNSVSNSSGRLTVRSRTNPLSKARATPSADPPPTKLRATYFVSRSSGIGGDGRWTALMFGILEGSRASSTRAFSRGRGEILIIRLLQISLPLQFFDLRRQFRKLLCLFLNVTKPSP